MHHETTPNDNQVALPELPEWQGDFMTESEFAEAARAYATEAVRLNQPAGGEAVAISFDREIVRERLIELFYRASMREGEDDARLADEVLDLIDSYTPPAAQVQQGADEAWADFVGMNLGDDEGEAPSQTFSLCRMAFDAGRRAPHPAADALGEWKNAVLNALAGTGMDADQDEPAYSILNRIIRWHEDAAVDVGALEAVRELVPKWRDEAERLYAHSKETESDGVTLRWAEWLRGEYVASAGATRRCASQLESALAQAPAVRGSDGIGLIAAERQRQVSVEGWTPQHDDDHIDGSLAVAAACYATQAGQGLYEEGVKARTAILRYWPWSPNWWKPTPNDRVRELVKAGALIAAEIDRLQRAEAALGQGKANG